MTFFCPRRPDNPRSEVNHIVDGDHGIYRGPYRMKRVVVPVVSIDSYAQSHGLAVVDVIKIDAGIDKDLVITIPGAVGIGIMDTPYQNLAGAVSDIGSAGENRSIERM